ENPSTWAQPGLKHRPNPCQREGLYKGLPQAGFSPPVFRPCSERPMRLSRSFFRPLRPLLASALLALTLTAACGRGDAETPPEKDDLIVARIQDRSVWASDVRREAVAQ